ncbi:MAG: iron-containing alcohol dehydrogenase [Clostridia bacterium]|nr:iron-containing alcohol dehydrogenase [Clostridia bacterium]
MECITENKLFTENEPYEKIIFEKDVYSSVVEYLKNYKKILIITSPTPQEKYLQFFINILNENKINFSISVLNKFSICDNDTILKNCAKGKGHNILIAFGTGTVTDVTKIVAKNLALPFCVIPTAITHYGVCNNIAYIINNGIPKIIKTEFPQKVFIDENIIKKSPERFVISSICFSLSLLENLFVLESRRRLLGECNIDLIALNKKIKKIEELLSWVSLSKDFALLNLMDYIIDLSELCKKSYESNAIAYSLTLKASTLKNNFGEKCLLSSTVLLNVYTSFFNQKKTYIKDIPNREKIIKFLSKINKNDDDFKNYMEKTSCVLQDQLRFSINREKKSIQEILSHYKNHLSKFSKKLLMLNNKSKLRMIDGVSLYSSLQVLPFIYNNYLLNILTRYGFMNVS